MRAVDLFAGFGGFTAGAEQAGVRVVWAANHWRLAVDVHAANHPKTHHVCQDLRQADWSALPQYELLLAAPACQGHSQASQPRRRAYHDSMRATAWAVVDCAEVTRPRAVVVENVLQFARWRLYPVWRLALEALGYRLRELVLTASHFGVPQRRRRLFMVGTRGRVSLDDLCRPGTEPAIGPCIDWDAGAWRPVAHAAPGARRRLEAASKRFGGRPCLAQHVTGHRGIAASEPIRTVTTKDQWVALRDGHYRPLSVRELARAMAFPEDYRLPQVARAVAVRGLGNAVCPPVARFLVERIAHELQRRAA